MGSVLRKKAIAVGISSAQIDAADDSNAPREVFIALIKESIQSQGEKKPGGGLLPPLECTQRAGQILYLPPAWHHATINLGEVLAVGRQQNSLSLSLAEHKALVDKYPHSAVIINSLAKKEEVMG